MSRRILGIDPGSRRTGWSVIISNGNSLDHIGSGVIKLGDGDFSDRLQKLYVELNEILDEYKPSEVAIEDIFLSHNVQSALKLGYARGVAILAVGQKGLLVSEFSARRIKQAVVGTGGAKKFQVQEMVRRLLTISIKLPEDAADACAVAICMAHSVPEVSSPSSKIIPDYHSNDREYLKRRRKKRFKL